MQCNMVTTQKRIQNNKPISTCTALVEISVKLSIAEIEIFINILPI